MSRQSVLVRFPQLIFVIFLLVTSSGSASEQSDVTTLSDGKTIERKLTGGQVHTYEIDLQLNEYAEIVVDQRSIDVSLTAYDSTGQKLTYVDGLRVPDQESLLLIGTTPDLIASKFARRSPRRPKGLTRSRSKSVAPLRKRTRTS